MIRALIVRTMQSKQKNFATFLDQTSMFAESYFCHNIQEMTEFLNKRPVDVIFAMASSISFTTADIFTALKQKEEWNDIPIFLFAENVTPEDRINALGMGAADFFSAQTQPMEISALTQFHVTKKHRIEKLRVTQEALFRRATTDPLTGLHTYEYFKSVIEERDKADVNGANQYAVLAIKPDYFDSIGETLGQNFSQKMMKSIGEVLKKICRKGDPLCKLDDSTFGLLFPHASEQQTLAAAERIRKRIVGQPMDYPLTISIGIAHKRGKQENPADKTVNEACLALKSANAKGSNRAELYRSRLDKAPKTIVPFQTEKAPVPASQASAAYASM